jgi:hypothetical protein
VNFSAASSTGTITGSWTNPGASGASVNETIRGLTPDAPYSITLVAENEAGEPGPASTPVSVEPYGTPESPTVSATQSGAQIVYNWSGGGDNNDEQGITYYLCINPGSCTAEGTQPGSYTTSQCCNMSFNYYGYVTDTHGQTSTNSVTQSVSVPYPNFVSIVFNYTSGCTDPVTAGDYGYSGSYTVTINTNGIPAQYVSGETVTTVYERDNNPNNTGSYSSTFTYDPNTSQYTGGPGAWGGWWHEDYTNVFTISMNVSGVGQLTDSLTTAFPACG